MTKKADKMYGLTRTMVKQVLFNFLVDYAKFLPEEPFNTKHLPNFGELDIYTKNYPELMRACMDGNDPELDKLITATIRLFLA